MITTLGLGQKLDGKQFVWYDVHGHSTLISHRVTTVVTVKFGKSFFTPCLLAFFLECSKLNCLPVSLAAPCQALIFGIMEHLKKLEDSLYLTR